MSLTPHEQELEKLREELGQTERRTLVLMCVVALAFAVIALAYTNGRASTWYEWIAVALGTLVGGATGAGLLWCITEAVHRFLEAGRRAQRSDAFWEEYQRVYGPPSAHR
jgi:hypothetical protein